MYSAIVPYIINENSFAIYDEFSKAVDLYTYFQLYNGVLNSFIKNIYLNFTFS